MESSEQLTEQQRDAISRHLKENWRIRCPYGHADLRDNDAPTVYCSSCKKAYHYRELLDSALESIPVTKPPERWHDDN